MRARPTLARLAIISMAASVVLLSVAVTALAVDGWVAKKLDPDCVP